MTIKYRLRMRYGWEYAHTHQQHFMKKILLLLPLHKLACLHILTMNSCRKLFSLLSSSAAVVAAVSLLPLPRAMLSVSIDESFICKSSLMRAIFNCSVNIMWKSQQMMKSRKNAWLPGKRYCVLNKLGATNRWRNFDNLLRSMFGNAICNSFCGREKREEKRKKWMKNYYHHHRLLACSVIVDCTHLTSLFFLACTFFYTMQVYFIVQGQCHWNESHLNTHIKVAGNDELRCE